MKKLYLLASILPMFGCSHFQADKNVSSNQVKMTEKTKWRGTSSIHTGSKAYTIKDLDNQVINPKGMENKYNLVSPAPKKDSIILDVIQINQNPELKYGCEVTSLAMVLNYAGVNTNKMDLYHTIQKDPDPLLKSAKGDIQQWGNPADGFVGDMTGKNAGYAVFDKPMIALINQKLPGRAVNLTNQPFERILEHVSSGHPVVVWTTGDYRLPDRPEGWYHGKQFIKTPLDLHAVVLVGYDANYVYLNDPLSGKKQVRVGMDQFISSWKALQSRAVSYQ
ncbi:C39 family peptidase [Neobacillus sp. NPDC097160]|uniref:C39 family peptidase n=1 Tax=Neobacillus sp. NPDC097160 TaxID=3364298 RepID=UPI003830219E